MLVGNSLSLVLNVLVRERWLDIGDVLKVRKTGTIGRQAGDSVIREALKVNRTVLCNTGYGDWQIRSEKTTYKDCGCRTVATTYEDVPLDFWSVENDEKCGNGSNRKRKREPSGVMTKLKKRLGMAVIVYTPPYQCYETPCDGCYAKSLVVPLVERHASYGPRYTPVSPRYPF